MNNPIINVADIEMLALPPALAPKGKAAERYDSTRGSIGRKLGAKLLGYNVTAVPPGKRAFPFHNHQVNEEMFFVLAGVGEIRIGVKTFPIRRGDVICCPAGGVETAHQIVNTGSEELRYLAVSTQQSPDVTEYPDTGRFGILAQLAANEDGTARTLMFVGREAESLNYWDSE